MAAGVTDWPSVYSGAKSYHPAVIPVFFRMGRIKHNRPGFGLPMRAIGNLELMKVCYIVCDEVPALKFPRFL